MIGQRGKTLDHQDLLNQCALVQEVRLFFQEKSFIDIPTPPLVPHPGYEAHLHPYGLYSLHQQKLTEHYLHTSPEFLMKQILSELKTDLFTICYAMRDEPSSQDHRNQFLMLEWYRSNTDYNQIAQDCEELLLRMSSFFEVPSHSLQRVSMASLFQECLNVDLSLLLEREELIRFIRTQKSVPLPESELSWEDLFHLLFLNLIEPKLKNWPWLIIDSYPAQLSALSNIDSSDPRFCKRFELYLHGKEVANCFDELIDLEEQEKRWKEADLLKKEIYHYSLGRPEKLFHALKKGLPPCAGIAMGLERLYQAFFPEGKVFPLQDFLLDRDQ